MINVCNAAGLRLQRRGLIHVFYPDSRLLMLSLALLLLQGSLYTVSWAGRDGQVQSINWSTLGLNDDQESQIDRLESQWKRAYSDLYPQILRDKTELRRLLNAPQSDERQIMELQSRIQSNEQRLRQEATRTFLHKKDQLNTPQRVRLQQMIGQ